MNNLTKWLSSKSSKYNDQLNKELVDELFSKLISFLHEMNDFNTILQFEEIEHLFYNFCFNKYSINSEKEINLCLDLTYHDKIVDLHLMFQNIAKSNGSLLFQNKGDTSYDILHFINNIVEEIEDYDDEENLEYFDDEIE
tara:strand:- start:1839 stop:2258 length:420 start_codon:yes stop_codon:yes gene_type:complete